MQLPDTNKVMTIGYALALLLVLFFVYKIMKAFGLIKSQAKIKEKAAEDEAIIELRAVPQFDISGLDTSKNWKDYSLAAQTYAEILRKAIRGLGTDEEAIYSTFSRLASKEDITTIALVYYKRYDRDLLIDLLNDLTDKEKAKLMNIINNI